MQFLHGTNIDFVGIRKEFFIASLIVTIAGLLAVGILGIKYGIDFVGGTEIIIKTSTGITTNDVRKAVEEAKINPEEVKSFGEAGNFLLRLKTEEINVVGFEQEIKKAFANLDPKFIEANPSSQFVMNFSSKVDPETLKPLFAKYKMEVSSVKTLENSNQLTFVILGEGQRISDSFKKLFPGKEVNIGKANTIGAKIGKEMQKDAYIAVLLAVLAMLIYIAFRFEFAYGVGAIIALVHDVLFTFAVIVVVNHLGWINTEFSQSILAAMLTVVGYSINDTVIVFDRIRENKDRHKGMNFIKMVNLSINETLSRTINTVLTVVLVLITMVLLAGPVLQGFSFTMLIGIIIGTYSSIYIASSFVIFYLEKVKKVSFEEDDKYKKGISGIQI
jgi:preprotein translocase subunit SecF